MYSPIVGAGSMMQWYVLRSFFALLAFAIVTAALAFQAQLGINPGLAVVFVVVAATITFPVTRPLVRMLNTPPMPVPPEPSPVFPVPANPTPAALPTPAEGTGG